MPAHTFFELPGWVTRTHRPGAQSAQIWEDKARMVEISKVPMLCRRAFYADLANAGAHEGRPYARQAVRS